MPNANKRFLETAIAAARRASGILLAHLTSQRDKEVEEKGACDFVTKVDRLAENALKDYISKRHPDHQILAEESGVKIGEESYEWIIDPLDGTKNYIHQFPMFAVSVALRRVHEMLVGVVIDPIRGELFYAQRGGGAYLNGKPIRVSPTQNFALCLLGTGFPFRAKRLAEPYFRAFDKLFHQISDFRRAGSAALDLAYVACGRLDGFWEVTLNPWDIAAGALIIQEAGGKVSDLSGGNDFLETGNIVASNGLVHEQIVAAVEPAFRDVRF